MACMPLASKSERFIPAIFIEWDTNARSPFSITITANSEGTIFFPVTLKPTRSCRENKDAYKKQKRRRKANNERTYGPFISLRLNSPRRIFGRARGKVFAKNCSSSVWCWSWTLICFCPCCRKCLLYLSSASTVFAKGLTSSFLELWLKRKTERKQ